MAKRICVLFLIVILLYTSIYSQDTVDLLFRILKFEKSLQTRTKGEINIAIVYNNNNKRSVQEAVKIADKLNTLSNERIQNLKVSHDIFVVDNNLKEKIKNYSVIFLSQGVKENRILDIAKKNKILTVAKNKNYRNKVGVVIAENDSENKFYVNVDILKEEGVNIAKELLSISKVYR